jgi:hypothetical protein
VERYDDGLSYDRKLSKAAIKISDIQNFVYGGFCSRFWILRKKIATLDPAVIRK